MEGTALSGNSREVDPLAAPRIKCNRDDSGAISNTVKVRLRQRGGISMGKLFLGLLLASSFLLAQDSSMSRDTSKDSKGQVTIQGCVSRSSGDYVLMKQDPGMTYELQATGKIKLRHYL